MDERKGARRRGGPIGEFNFQFVVDLLQEIQAFGETELQHTQGQACDPTELGEPHGVAAEGKDPGEEADDEGDGGGDPQRLDHAPAGGDLGGRGHVGQRRAALAADVEAAIVAGAADGTDFRSIQGHGKNLLLAGMLIVSELARPVNKYKGKTRDRLSPVPRIGVSLLDDLAVGLFLGDLLESVLAA